MRPRGEITFPTKKISINYHFNKFSEFTEHILFETWSANLSATWCLLVHDIISYAFNITFLLSVCDF